MAQIEKEDYMPHTTGEVYKSIPGHRKPKKISRRNFSSESINMARRLVDTNRLRKTYA